MIWFYSGLGCPYVAGQTKAEEQTHKKARIATDADDVQTLRKTLELIEEQCQVAVRDRQEESLQAQKYSELAQNEVSGNLHL